MTKDFGQNDPKIIQYVAETFKAEDPILEEIRIRSTKNGLPEIQVGELDGLHIQILTLAIGAQKAVEIGTLGGYSGVHIARGLKPDGKLFTFELNSRNAEVAKESFTRAGVEKKVQIFIGPALDNLKKIENEGPFDLVFIDADKASYPQYLRWAAENLRIGGIVLGDNTFAWGTIANQTFKNEDEASSVKALQKFNFEVAQGGRFRATILPTGEGLTFGVKVK